MYRRRLLAGVGGVAGLTALAGCSLFDPTREETQTTADRPRTVEPYTEPAVTPAEGDDAETPTQAATVGSDCLSRAVHVHNTADFDQYVTVALDALDGTASVVRSTSVPAGDTVTHDAVVDEPRRYRVTVDTADGRVGSGEFVVSKGVSDLTVYVGPDGIRTRQQAIGWPDCPLVSTDGTAAATPTLAEAIRWYGLQRLVVDNVGPETTTARVRAVATDGAGTLLDYGYRLPPGMRVDLPVVPRAGTYDVTVDEGGERRTRRWDVDTDLVAGFTVGDGVAVGADRPTNSPRPAAHDSVLHHLVNGDNRPHAVTLTVRRAGRLVVGERYNLGIDETVLVRLPLPAGGGGEVAVTTGDGAEATVAWPDCPPEGTVVVGIDDRGLFRVYSDRRGILVA